MVMYPQQPQPQIHHAMSPPPYSPQMQQQPALGPTPIYSHNQAMAPPSTYTTQPMMPVQNYAQPPNQQMYPTKSAPPYPEPNPENEYSVPNENNYEPLGANRQDNTYETQPANTYQNQAFSP